jgi:sodium/proline symporter
MRASKNNLNERGEKMQNLPLYLGFGTYFLVIILISLHASREINNLSSFVLGARKLSGPITALGVGASDMSGFLLLSVPGTIYAVGLSKVWMPIGLLVGAYLNWRLVAKRLRNYSEQYNQSLTIPAYLDNRFNDRSGIIRIITALVILIFFTFYAASGFVAGALLFKTIFNISYLSALMISAGFIAVYTLVGGFLAVNRVDFFQGTLMLFALIVVPLVTINMTGGVNNTIAISNLIDSNFLSLSSNTTWIGIVSMLSWGLGYFGQPHILVRFMAIHSTDALPTARRIHITWMFLALSGTVLTGLAGFAFFGHAKLADSESVFIQLVQLLFNPWMASILYAAVLSAFMSTIAAQLLACSSSLTEDIYHRFLRKRASDKELIWISRFTILLVTITAMLLADPNSTVLSLVAYAWAGMGAAFGPVILFSLYCKNMTRLGAILGMSFGALGVISWETLNIWFNHYFEIYELVPGFLLACLGIFLGNQFGKASHTAK